MSSVELNEYDLIIRSDELGCESEGISKESAIRCDEIVKLTYLGSKSNASKEISFKPYREDAHLIISFASLCVALVLLIKVGKALKQQRTS